MTGGLTPQQLAALANAALDDHTEAAAEPILAEACQGPSPDPGVLHWLGLLRRALDRREAAIPALTEAARLRPADAGIAHSLAQVRLEAGLPAVAAFGQAITLAPSQPDLRLGLAGARLAAGQGRQALDELGAMLAANPGWYDGHRQYAQLAALVGAREQALASVEAALQRFPAADALHELTLELLLAADSFEAAVAAAERALRVVGPSGMIPLAHATALDEAGRGAEAARAFAALGEPDSQDHAVRLIRHRLRRGEAGAAAALVERWLALPFAENVWPYAALAWRSLGDPRAEWLDGEAALIRTVDLGMTAAQREELAALLRQLHQHAGPFLDQSVRRGTQTSGPLLARIEPPLAQLRERFRMAVADYIAALPPSEAAHPCMGVPRDGPVRFSGSWSVRLTGSGHHAAHHHPAGWISSAFYVSVPPLLAGTEGWLELGGAPAGLGCDLAPRRLVPPAPGTLVMFPSWMWHGTRPFTAGERLTIAFDVARP